MIQLPPNYLEMAVMDNSILWLHFVNDAGQFWTHMLPIDPALQLDDQLQMMALALTPEALAGARAYVLQPSTMQREEVEPSDQNWKPAPVTALTAISLPQYRTLKGLPNA